MVRELALDVMDRLVDEGVKLLVIACNSASAAVLRDARERYTEGRGIPVVEVIQPAVRRAVAATRNNRVGVIGTNATVASKAYDDAFAAAVDLLGCSYRAGADRCKAGEYEMPKTLHGFFPSMVGICIFTQALVPWPLRVP